MAFSGLHVVCAYAGSKSVRAASQPIMGDIQWTETPASGVVSANAAVLPNEAQGDPIFRMRAAVDSWVSIGPNPNANAHPRLLVSAGIDYDAFVEPGDKVHWIAA